MSSRKRERVLTHTGTSRSSLNGIVTLVLTDESEPDRPYRLLLTSEEVEALARFVESCKAGPPSYVERLQARKAVQ